ncbi:sulfurtransferase complex subunit TusC [Pseudomonas gingeri]|uniref:Sulfurtransferase complex subunit TusC n=1 Tax=Pseudomonas gingeri TaxID=117681 RepID=A0A7Y8CN95_9PSED|nr:sulfurtransferase complex subunit TusC [Pseudomonas gingeri]NWA04777.1 sulfurtransferase complex subunit TusC [Pseudomonas gingeri]NWA17658.1 sulfurtransferase complex subunit TusC [Pseudomonas gingeri]NWA56934.1 sulfurtransferase complex subunit TusC [Pseudomonas gingeri]NWA97200.1 sulfurtransferase complex subunit TusC [Pseudomonas gingeri]NWB01748.1 sulfurtransferase complex subunit TusC [Pseudomonas gingeri]
MPKSLLIISRQAPWSGPSAREALDIVLAGGAFDLPIGLLFMDDGVFQLTSGQNARAVQQKDLTANLQALSLFGVEDLYACRDSLADRGLFATQVAGEDLSLLTAEEIVALVNRYDQVITL